MKDYNKNLFRQIDLTKPDKKYVTEFRRLTGLGNLFESSDWEEVDLTKDQVDPEEQIDADSKDRDVLEKKMKRATDFEGNEVWDGSTLTKKSEKKSKK